MHYAVAVRFHQPVIRIPSVVGASPPGEGVAAIGGLNERRSRVIFLPSIRLRPLHYAITVRFHQPVIRIREYTSAVGLSRPG
ncbi:MAG: hypothetical protein ACFFC7_09130 [Candidatus Hermodarchaeota archaeon]